MTDPFNEAAASRKELIAEDDAEGRIDAWLTAALGQEFSRNRVKALIEQGVDIDEARWVGADLESIFFTETGSVQAPESIHAG